MSAPAVRCLIGSYAIDPAMLVFKNENTAHVYSPNHEGAMVKFVGEFPQQGDLVMATSVLDTCYERGANGHRPAVKRVLRIKKIENRHPDKPIYPLEIVESVPGWNPGYSLQGTHVLRLRFPDQEAERMAANQTLRPPLVPVATEWNLDDFRNTETSDEDLVLIMPRGVKTLVVED